MKTCCVIGDSIARGYGPYLKEAAGWFLDVDTETGQRIAFENPESTAKRRGGDSSTVLDRLRNRFENESFQPDYIVLNCGLHDIKTDIETGRKNVAIDRYDTNLNDIFRMIKQRGIGLFWVRTTPVIDQRHNSICKTFYRYGADVKIYNEKADTIAREHSIAVIELYQFTQSLGEDIYCDHVHFIDEAQKSQAAFIAGYLSSIISGNVLRVTRTVFDRAGKNKL